MDPIFHIQDCPAIMSLSVLMPNARLVRMPVWDLRWEQGLSVNRLEWHLHLEEELGSGLPGLPANRCQLAACFTLWACAAVTSLLFILCFVPGLHL